MPHLYPHKIHGYQVVYRVFFPDGTYIDKSKTRKRKYAAQDILSDVSDLENHSRQGSVTKEEVIYYLNKKYITQAEADALNGGRKIAAEDISRAVDDYLLTSEIKSTPATHKVNKVRAEKIKAWLEEKGLSTLESRDVEQYIADRKSGARVHPHKISPFVKKGVSDKTIKEELLVMQMIIDKAVKLGMVEKNVAREITVKVKKKKLRRAYSKDEVKAIIQSARENKHLAHGYGYELFMTALYTGFRRGQLRVLEWERDVDFENGLVHSQGKEIEGEADFTTKSGNTVTVVMPGQLRAVLETLYNSRGGEGSFVFGGEAPISINVISTVIKTIILRAGVDPKLSLHHARHTFISEVLKRSKGDLRYTQERAGHRDIQSTKAYAHVITPDHAPEIDMDFEMP